MTDGDTWFIEIYDFDVLRVNTDEESFSYILKDLVRDESNYQYARCFLLEDAEGKIYYIRTDID